MYNESIKTLLRSTVLCFLFANALILFLSAVGEVTYTGYNLAKNSTWNMPTVSQVIEKEYLYYHGKTEVMPVFYDWYMNPTDWIGLHKVCSTVFVYLPLVMFYSLMSLFFTYLSLKFIYWSLPPMWSEYMRQRYEYISDVGRDLSFDKMK